MKERDGDDDIDGPVQTGVIFRGREKQRERLYLLLVFDSHKNLREGQKGEEER